jgi:lipopolysaccharide heptosyltransferase I
MTRVSRFLVIRLSSIGDIVHALPAVAALGETGAEIHWAVESRFAPLLEGNPSIQRVVRLDTLALRLRSLRLRSGSSTGSPTSSNGERFGVAAENFVRGIAALRASEYDAAIDFQGLVKSALIGRLSRARERVGFSEHWLREPLAGVFYTDRVNPRVGPPKHVIEMNLSLAERLGAKMPERREDWEFPLSRSEREESAVAARLESLGIQDFIILNPGGGWSEKRWPPNDYAEFIRRFAAEFTGHFLLTGSKAEEPEIEFILRSAHCARACYFPSTLLEFIGLARRARLMVSGDTGPMHLAAAVGTPIVAIFSGQDPLNTPERNGPFSPDDFVVVPGKGLLSGVVVTLPGNARARAFQPDVKNYVLGVKVEAVVRAARQRLAVGASAAADAVPLQLEQDE